jgi:hypothetical protein
VIDPKTALISFCNVTETIVAAFAHRITPDIIPDKQPYPFARIKLIGSEQAYHANGEGYRKHLLQIDVYDPDQTSANSSAEVLRKALSGYVGTMGDMQTGRVKARIVQSNWNTTSRDFWRIIEVEIPTND